tara:strand:- start:544 stop:711 length:168 start_codon:yes stop_codon:yes gene_type:complete
MANREGMLFKFFEKWKNKKLNKFAKNLLKKDPKLNKNLEDLADSFRELEKRLDKR